MQQTKHAEQMVNRFRELVEDTGDSLSSNHYNELKLIIEAGLDTALLENLKRVTEKLTGLAHDIQHDTEFFD
jgi:hypothetical protein